MAQNSEIQRPMPHYTRSDYTALRALLNKIPVTKIIELYFNEDDLASIGCPEPAQLEARLEGLRDHLIHRAEVANPRLSEALREARRASRWGKVALDYLFKAAEFEDKAPQPSDAVSAWMKPRVARNLREDGLDTLHALMKTIEMRGPGWYRPIKRLGEMKAAAIVRWLQQNERSLGKLNLQALRQVVATNDRAGITLRPDHEMLVPLDGIRLTTDIDGSTGLNRNHVFPLISARNDLAAIQAYLTKFEDRLKTQRAYRKELERLLLWSIYKARKPMSSLMVEDCQNYLAFLRAPDPMWCGKRAERWTVRWRPFEGKLSPESQKYALTVIRAFFAWLVNVRYLGGNPWVAVKNPVVEKRINKMQIEKALPEAFWGALSCEGGLLDEAIEHADLALRGQLRLARAALLLIGSTGLRREEACRASRRTLVKLADKKNLWELQVLGKGSKWRSVFPSGRVVDAIRAHWEDRGEEFNEVSDALLLSPLVIPGTKTAKEKHHDCVGGGFSASGLYTMIKTALRRISDNRELNLNDFERQILASRGLHAFRHTFGTIAVGKGMPIDVLQKAMGHESLDTTSIYVQAERKRMIDEIEKFVE